MPPAWPALGGSPADWADRTVPQPGAGVVVSGPLGRALGGSSAVNAMNFVPGHRDSDDAWIEAGRRAGGSTIACRSSSAVSTSKAGTGAARTGRFADRPGPIPHPLAGAGLDAAWQAGYRATEDISGGLEPGFGWCDLTIVDGRRESAADASLSSVLTRPTRDVVDRRPGGPGRSST